MSNLVMPRLRRTAKSIAMAVGFDFYQKTEDRKVLEDTILPAIARSPEYQRILFIGCDWYMRGYQRVFAGRDYWTLEIDSSKSKYGARQHIVDSAENLALHFKPNSLDIIVCNGVIGWGLDDRDGIERMLESCGRCLRDRGVLLIGWNDVPEHMPPVPLSEFAALQTFQPFVFPALAAAELETNSELRHRYNFYSKTARES